MRRLVIPWLGFLLAACTANSTYTEAYSTPVSDRPANSKLIATAWGLRAVSGARLTIVVPEGGCDGYDHVEIVETNRLVTITAFVHELLPSPASGNGPALVCLAQLMLRPRAIQLHSALASRTLRHGFVDPSQRVYQKDVDM